MALLYILYHQAEMSTFLKSTPLYSLSGQEDAMNYQYLLRQIYDKPELQKDSTVIIENPFEEKEGNKSSANSAYYLSILNTSLPADEIVEMVQNAIANDRKTCCGQQGIRILFYGLSGAGKTNLAHYLADSIGRKLLCKNASDILGMYVGESEKNIANAFAEAKKANKVLLFDEVDSFFRERTLASQRFEITETNEFLTQMENYDGIVICTTNLRGIMDKAMQRRFHIMVEFKALKTEGVVTLLSKYFPQFEFDDNAIQSLCKYGSVTPGDFGNIASRLRFMRQEKITNDYIIRELCKVQEEKESDTIYQAVYSASLLHQASPLPLRGK